jgi:hypothetical protein
MALNVFRVKSEMGHTTLCLPTSQDRVIDFIPYPANGRSKDMLKPNAGKVKDPHEAKGASGQISTGKLQLLTGPPNTNRTKSELHQHLHQRPERMIPVNWFGLM